MNLHDGKSIFASWEFEKAVKQPFTPTIVKLNEPKPVDMKRILIVSMIFAALLAACKKEDSTGTSRLSIKLTDAPALYDKVNLDLKGVSVIVNDTVINLDVNTGVFNLLDLVNGKRSEERRVGKEC